MSNSSPRTRRPIWVYFGWGAAVLLIGALIGWAASTVIAPSKTPVANQPYTLVKASAGTVGSHFSLEAIAEWGQSPVASNLADGTVTTLVATPGEEAKPGDVLYTVDLQPVVIAQGLIPSFEQLGTGSRGADVAQLQQFLHSIGHPVAGTSGVWSWQTTAAVRAWQTSIGAQVTGTVAASAIMYVPQLPARITLNAKNITRGAIVTPGEQAISELSAQPAFTMDVTNDQSAVIPSGTSVTVSHSGNQWDAIVGDKRTTSTSGVTLQLTTKSGAAVCENACQSLAIDGKTELAANVVIVPSTTGTTIPAASIQSDPSGHDFVVLKSGRHSPVVVIASAQGLSVVRGVAMGSLVRIYSTSQQ